MYFGSLNQLLPVEANDNFYILFITLIRSNIFMVDFYTEERYPPQKFTGILLFQISDTNKK